ncbi:MAG: glycerol-3-phosphate dehydrogenase, partial [Puniceicoccales bacterium]|nr:glycerol-3-phosphate dehydrogenase [Puniceicoccales bacterium]
GSCDWSRTRTFGLRFGAGEDPAAFIAGEKTTVEGYRATKGFHDICHKNNISCPVLDGIYGILYESVPAAEIGNAFMARALREEAD